MTLRFSLPYIGIAYFRSTLSCQRFECRIGDKWDVCHFSIILQCKMAFFNQKMQHGNLWIWQCYSNWRSYMVLAWSYAYVLQSWTVNILVYLLVVLEKVSLKDDDKWWRWRKLKSQQQILIGRKSCLYCLQHSYTLFTTHDPACVDIWQHGNLARHWQCIMARQGLGKSCLFNLIVQISKTGSHSNSIVSVYVTTTCRPISALLLFGSFNSQHTLKW